MIKCFLMIVAMNGTVIGDERIFTKDEAITDVNTAFEFVVEHREEILGEFIDTSEIEVVKGAAGCYDYQTENRIWALDKLTVEEVKEYVDTVYFPN